MRKCKHEFESLGSDYAICKKCYALKLRFLVLKNPAKKPKKAEEEWLWRKTSEP